MIPVSAMEKHDWLDRVAIGGSVLCLVHCLALPFAIAMLPALGRIFHLPEDTHVWLLLFVVPATGLALLTGYMRHRRLRPVAIGGSGLALLAVAALLLLETPWETPLTVLGSLIIAGAHLANWSLRHGRGACDCAEEV